MFNLSKYADLDQMIMDGTESIGDSIATPEDVSRTQDEVIGDLTGSGPDADEKARVLQLQQDQDLLGVLNDLKTQYPAEVEAINSFLSNNLKFRQLQNELPALSGLSEQYNMQAITQQVPSFDEYKEKSNNVLNAVRRLNAIQREYERNQIPLGISAFNLRQHKKAQMPQMLMPQAPVSQMSMPEQTERFPVENEGDFIAKFADDLLAFNNNPGTPEYERARIAVEEIRAAVSPGFEEEANSVLEAIKQLDVTQRNTASDYLIRLYEVMIPPALTGDQAGSQMEPVMSEKNKDVLEGIVRFSLTDSVLNNNKDAMMKTAADQFGQQYLLYGPTEKRICPKLRGKNLSVGDVVSEYTCRHHCLDGIVIDDNKTICGEALWRANAMDKYSREYVDEDGNIEGGYINKRFEVNRNVSEENKMRLKPGETRKPKPAAWGSTESRLQDMRSKEGQSRDYRPETNTGDPFEWCHDSDQNNVEVSQAERDRREEAMGNKLVQYTNRDQGENNPKKAFNMKEFKTAQTPVAYKPMDTHQTAVNPSVARVDQPSDIETGHQTFDSGKPMIDPESFQGLLFAINEVQNEDDVRKIQVVADRVIRIPRQWEIFGQHLAKRMGELGINEHEEEPMPQRITGGFNLSQFKKEAKSPPGFKHTVEHMKSEHGDEIDNPFALCLDGDTEIPNLSGGVIPVKDLVNRDFWVYSIHPETHTIVAGQARAKYVGEKQVHEIVLDNFKKIICTGEHRWMLRNGEYKHTKKLKPGDSLMPFKTIHDKSNHELVYHPGLQRYSETHVTIANSLNSNCPASGYVLHHKDTNPRNNSPDNLDWITKGQHKSIHMRKMWKSEDYREKMLVQVSKNGQKISERTSSMLKNKWATDTEFSRKMVACNQKNAKSAGILAGIKHQEKAESKFQKIMNDVDSQAFMDCYSKLGSIKKTGEQYGLSCHYARKLFQELTSNNHKIVSIRPLGIRPVYDVSVDKYHNFAVSAGVFSHNSWWMKNKGYKSHKGPGDVDKGDKDKKKDKESMLSADIRDSGVKNTHVQALLDRKHKAGKPVGMPTPEKTASSKKKNVAKFNLSTHKSAQVIHIHLKGHELGLHPQFLHEDFGGDANALRDFLDNLHDDECSIIAQHGKDLRKLKYMKARADHDIATTAKDLCMEG